MFYDYIFHVVRTGFLSLHFSYVVRSGFMYIYLYSFFPYAAVSRYKDPRHLLSYQLTRMKRMHIIIIFFSFVYNFQYILVKIIIFLILIHFSLSSHFKQKIKVLSVFLPKVPCCFLRRFPDFNPTFDARQLYLLYCHSSDQIIFFFFFTFHLKSYTSHFHKPKVMEMQV